MSAKARRIRLVFEFDVTQDLLDFRVEAIFDHIENFDSVRLVKSHAELVNMPEEEDNVDRTAIQSIH